MSTIISLENLSEVIQGELTIYGQNIIDEIKKKAKQGMDLLVKETKATAPVGKRKKHYRNSIKGKKTRENDRSVSYTWYVNGPDYRLSHLLENGHALRTGGRVEGSHFIKKASDPIIEKYIKDVEEIIKNG